MHEKELKKYFSLGFIIILALFLGFAIRKYVSAFFGALIFFYLFIGIYIFFIKKLKFSKQLSAILVILLSLLLIILPAYFVVDTAIDQVSEVYQSRTELSKVIDEIDSVFPTYNVRDLINSQLTKFGEFVQTLAISSVKSLSNIFISMTIMFFVLYYLLVNYNSVDKKLIWLIPFNKRNSKRLVTEFKNVTYSTVITSGVIAVIQGSLVAIGFTIFGLKGAFFWGFVAAILSFLPVVGAPMIWLPAALILFLQNNYVFGIGMLIWGEILSNIDNFIRPHLQKKIGRIHPLITIIGIFIGLPIFGLLGLIIGPLLLSYFILSVQMFRDEYLENEISDLNIYEKKSKGAHSLVKVLTKKKKKKKN